MKTLKKSSNNDSIDVYGNMMIGYAKNRDR